MEFPRLLPAALFFIMFLIFYFVATMINFDIDRDFYHSNNERDSSQTISFLNPEQLSSDEQICIR